MAMPTAPLTGQPSIDYARGTIGGHMPDSGLCLQYTRQNYEVPSKYASAIDAWNAATEQHPGDANPPPSAPVWFHSSSVYRHIAYHLGDGQYATTFNADIRQMSFQSMLNTFGPLIGWAPDLNGYSLRPATLPTPPPDDQEDDMLRPMFLRRKDGAMVVIAGNGAKALSFDHWQVWQNLGYTVTHDEMDPGPFDALIEDMGGWAPE